MQAKTFDFKSQKENSRMPIKSLRAGALQVAIWENENVIDGTARKFQTASFERRYKDRNGQWQSTNSLRVNDLPKAAMLLSKAYEYMIFAESEEE